MWPILKRTVFHSVLILFTKCKQISKILMYRVLFWGYHNLLIFLLFRLVDAKYMCTKYHKIYWVVSYSWPYKEISLNQWNTLYNTAKAIKNGIIRSTVIYFHFPISKRHITILALFKIAVYSASPCYK